MRLPVRDIWEARVQGLCGVVCAGEELWLCGNYGQASLDPPRVVINPNRLYPIEAAIREQGRFALCVLGASQREEARRIAQVRRREPDKAGAAGVRVATDETHGVPYLTGCPRVLFCDLEQALSTGDHTVMLGRIREIRNDASRAGERPLHYRDLARIAGLPDWLQRALSALWLRSGMREAVYRLRLRRGGPPAADLQRNTYLIGGHTETELLVSQGYGLVDRSRRLKPPEAPAGLRRRIGVCIAGTGAWGAMHCAFFRQASSLVDLYICGGNTVRTRRLAQVYGAAGVFSSLDEALADSRIEAVSLVLPHHVHATAACKALEAGRHVLVEKPIATTLEDAGRMIETAERAGKVLAVAENAHFRPAVAEAVRAIARGDIGEPLYLEVRAGTPVLLDGWKADASRMGGGVFLDIGIHYVRAMRLLMGEPDRVWATRAMTVNARISGDDSTRVIFASEAGWQAHLLLSWVSPSGGVPDITVAGDRGLIALWPQRAYYDYYPAEPPALARALSLVRPAWLAEKLRTPNAGRIRRQVPGVDPAGYLAEVRDFLDAIATGRQTSSPGMEGRRDLELVLAGYRALETGVWTPIP
ncbi:MAG: Gfo/Idh/MocA family oxidoreductase [Bryobacterales bacterium]|nr:Gfo/Idh/MocA family oxidoreductase [Bryobacterales bacterium]